MRGGRERELTFGIFCGIITLSRELDKSKAVTRFGKLSERNTHCVFIG